MLYGNEILFKIALLSTPQNEIVKSYKYKTFVKVPTNIFNKPNYFHDAFRK